MNVRQCRSRRQRRSAPSWTRDIFQIVAIPIALGLMATSSWAQGPSPSIRNELGLTALSELLGDLMPTGAGIKVGQVESPLTAGGTNYMPNGTQFASPDSQLLDDTITDKNGSGTVSSHATAVAQGIYGTNGVAPGVDSVDVYNANNWIYASQMRTTNYRAPIVATQKVINNSWVATFSGSDGLTTAVDLLRRVDYVVNRDQVVVVSSVNNGLATSFPQVVASAYNGIAVGLTNGYSSPGPTTIDGAGRSKPDLVVPATSTSVGTGWVSGAAALLLEVAGSNAAAAHPETIKAVLMAGAVKTPFDTTDSTPSTLDNWSHTPEQPLDLLHGAGQLNVYNSMLILGSGQQSASDTSDVSLQGWDYAAVAPTTTTTYFFEISEGEIATSFSAIATWNRQIDFQQGINYQPATLTPSLANVDIALFHADGYSATSLIESSQSTIDNVEHLYQTWLPAGRYEISVTTDSDVNMALAWNAQTVLLGDANNDGSVDGADYTNWADNFLQTGAGWGQGDFTLDGKVDGADYTVWADHFLNNVTLTPVPEPSTFALGLLGLSAGLLGCLRRWQTSSSN